MKNQNPLSLHALSCVAVLLFSSAGYAADKAAPAPSDAAKSAYPLQTCIVSGDKLEPNSMGGPVDFIYRQAGKPDRLIRFCCKDCIADFEKDPAKYLKKLDETAAAKPTENHSEHKH